MDLIAIILAAMKKWKPAFITSMVGIFLILIGLGLSVIKPLVFFISLIIYIVIIVISVNKIKEENKEPNVLELKLKELNRQLVFGNITKDEYDELRREILNN